MLSFHNGLAVDLAYKPSHEKSIIQSTLAIGYSEVEILSRPGFRFSPITRPSCVVREHLDPIRQIPHGVPRNEAGGHPGGSVWSLSEREDATASNLQTLGKNCKTTLTLTARPEFLESFLIAWNIVTTRCLARHGRLRICFQALEARS
jgi:hypothetical protein